MDKVRKNKCLKKVQTMEMVEKNLPSNGSPPSVLDQWPEDDTSNKFFPCSFFSRLWKNWTFAYMSVVLQKGSQQTRKGGSHLSQDDLFVVPRSMKSTELVASFAHFHHYFKDKERDSRRRLLKTLWKISKASYIPAGLCELMVVICGVSMPLLVRGLLVVLENNPNKQIISAGVPYATAIFSVSVVNAFGNNRHRHLALKTGIALRAAIVNMIYQHVLQLSPEGKNKLTSGEVVNLVAVDTQKIFEVSQDLHLVWALPMSILLVSFFLYRTLGACTLIGIAVLIAFVPLIQTVTSQMLKARSKRVRFTDQRVEIVGNMLQGIKVTKLNNYEHNYETRVIETRNKELKHLRTEMAIWATTLCMTVVSPVIATAATFICYVFLDKGNVLTAADTFGVLLLFSALRFPINFAGRLIGKAAQALSAVQRIAVFLDRHLRNEDEELYLKIESTEKEANQFQVDSLDCLVLSNASFRIGSSSVTLDDSGGAALEGVRTCVDSDVSKRDDTRFTVSAFDFSVAKGEVYAVCGPVGSGKSTLLNGILDETEVLGHSNVIKRGKLSYVPQTPFILNETVRENILFGLPYDNARYERVLDACCLRPDLEQLGVAGDLTEIGERGVTLSGGQKQRISLARAAYAQSSIVILDDPFSALDAGTGRAVFERLLLFPGALLRNAAVVLVTHASHFISHRAVNKILLVVDGSNRFLGTWDELAAYEPTNESTKRAVDFIKSTVREDTQNKETDDEEEEISNIQENDESKTKGRLMKVEEREHGLSSIKTWLLWFKRAGGMKFFFFQVLFMALDRTIYVAIEWFLARWTSATEQPVTILGIDFPAQTDGFSAQGRYVQVYGIMLVLMVVAVVVRSEWAVTGGGKWHCTLNIQSLEERGDFILIFCFLFLHQAHASKNVFQSMLSSVLLAPMSYFETVPMGRILNRFTYDTDVNDVTLTQAMTMFLISWSWYFAGVILQVSILPWSAIAIVPVSAMYWVLVLHYRRTGPDLQRLDALSRSPLQSMVTECLDGSTSIRVFQQDQRFVDRFRAIVDSNSSALLNFISAQRWLGVRMELLGSIVVLVSSILVVCLNDVLRIEAGLVGLLIMWSANFTITLNFMVDTFAETEAAITAIERVDAMADLPSEKGMETSKENAIVKSWPENGTVCFDNVSLRYRAGLPLALNGLTFDLPAGKSCGVVGRTGAGKSSIAVALFRLVEIESGKITLDGVDLSTIGLSDVRGRGISIIPQDPFLAGATLRDCLDPFRQHSDSDIVEALEAVRMGSTHSEDDEELLSTRLEEGGSNYSMGERQLLNLSRALLSQPKLLVLDEATASIDGETDAFVQRMLRAKFPETTLITIAHRLNTIMDHDLVLVIDAGQAVEFASPVELLDKSDGIFSELVDATGGESSSALRQMAINAAATRCS
jgi:ABC-type multidrug transport system fused ATPase/permease subunit